MNNQTHFTERLSLLEERILHLEEAKRLTVDALEMAATLGNFQPHIAERQEPATILKETGHRLKGLIAFEATSFYLVNEEDSNFFQALTEPDTLRSEIDTLVDALIENGTFAWAFRESRPVIVPVTGQNRYLVIHSMTTTQRIRGLFVGLLPKDKMTIPDVSLSLLSVVLLNCANALESFELYRVVRDINQSLERTVRERTRQLEFQALHDALTGLANRTLLFDRLDYEIRSSERSNKKMALLLVDLDRFKEVNDSLGHLAGDSLLKNVGQRLLGVVRQSDTVARLGGDEFAVLLSEVKDHLGALAATKKILDALKEPYLLKGHTVNIGGSVGIAFYPDHGQGSEDLLRKADVAMYTAKQEQQGVLVYDPTMDAGTTAKLTLLGDLRRAIQEQTIGLNFLPRVSLVNGSITGIEALARWYTPQHGSVPPNVFIPLAEQSGLCQELTELVLNLACHTAKQWFSAGLRLPVSINLGAKNLLDPLFPDRIQRLLNSIELPCSLLEIEITENAIMVSPTQAHTVLKKLSHMGLPLAVDDFGTGFSCLSVLKGLPVQSIKIDTSFVRNMDQEQNDRSIVQAAIDLGHHFGFSVTAEGVERKEIWDLLRTMNCDAAQGFHIARPMDSQELTQWLAQPPHMA